MHEADNDILTLFQVCRCTLDRTKEQVS
jgi:hypothetical protein